MSKTTDRLPAYRDEAGRVFNAAGLPLYYLPLSKLWMPDISDLRWERALYEEQLADSVKLGSLTQAQADKARAEMLADPHFFESDWIDGQPNPNHWNYAANMRMMGRGIGDLIESANDEDGA